MSKAVGALAMSMTRSIEEHHGTLARERFGVRFLRESKPVVLRDEPATRALAGSLTLDQLASHFGAVVVPVKHSRTPVFHPERGRIEELPMRELVDHVHGGAASGAEWVYLQQLALSVLLPHGPPPLPSLLDGVRDPDVRLWVGSAGCITVLHHDRADNVLMQLQGTKRITLFDPYQGSLLYPQSTGSAWAHVSRIAFEPEPDLVQFPRFAQARSIEVTLGPGDALFIPAWWWHLVRSETSAVSINAWW